MINSERIEIVTRLIAEMSPEEISELAPGFIALSKERGGGEPILRETQPSEGKDDLSLFGVLPGHVSADQSVIVGKGGFLFIWQGGNKLADQYLADPLGKELGRLVDTWNSVIRRRMTEFKSRGISFVQLIIPEKSSVLPELFPLSRPSETPLLHRLDANFRTEPAHVAYLSSLSRMREDTNRLTIFRRLDSHLSPYGAWLTFCHILKKLGQDLGPVPNFIQQRIQASDLGEKFADLPLRELVFSLPPNAFSKMEAELSQVECKVPENGQHLGTRVVWKNKTSLLPLRVIAFGNSFFEQGRTPANLSWWAARWFREFHFVWSPYVDYAYVDNHAPDVVVCQAIERFLPITPRS